MYRFVSFYSFLVRLQLRIQGGAKEAMRPPPLYMLKLVFKKMAPLDGPFYLLFLGPPPL